MKAFDKIDWGVCKVKVVIQPGRLLGKIKIPPSKSFAHRALICGALSDGESIIYNCGNSEDISATKNCLSALGRIFEAKGDELAVKAGGQKGNVLDCGESGSTLRFMLPVALALGGEYLFMGRGRLMSRPLEDYFRIFKRQGIYYEMDKERGMLKVSGRLLPDKFSLSGNISSQYLTGLLLALPLLDGDSEIVLNSPLQSAGYVDMTRDIQGKFGVVWEKERLRYFVRGNQLYKAATLECEGDYSQAAFWLAADRLGCGIEVIGLNPGTFQPDRAIADLIQAMPKETDVSQYPDLVPILAVLCALSPGRRILYNAARLRLKESDRLHAVSMLISGLGGNITEKEDALIIEGKEFLDGGVCDSFGDHRIAMSAAIAAVKSRGPVTVLGAQSVNKSYPEFWEHYIKLGGRIEKYDG